MSKGQRGGPGRGQGRKPLEAGQPTTMFGFRLTPSQRIKLDALGGAEWLRSQIDQAPDSDKDRDISPRSDTV